MICLKLKERKRFSLCISETAILHLHCNLGIDTQYINRLINFKISNYYNYNKIKEKKTKYTSHTSSFTMLPTLCFVQTFL